MRRRGIVRLQMRGKRPPGSVSRSVTRWVQIRAACTILMAGSALRLLKTMRFTDMFGRRAPESLLPVSVSLVRVSEDLLGIRLKLTS